MLAALLVTLGACQAERGALEGLPGAVRSQIGTKTEEMAPCVVASLPEPVRRVLAEAAHEKELVMADPGQPWNSGDKGVAGLPRQRLVRAAHGGQVWVVDFAKGGFASTYRVMVVRVEGDAARVLWSGTCDGWTRRGKWRCDEDVKRPAPSQ